MTPLFKTSFDPGVFRKTQTPEMTIPAFRI
jgi:hypothetical protein